MERLYGVTDLAEISGTSASHIRNLIRRKAIPVVLLGKRLVVRSSSWQAYVERCEINAPAKKKGDAPKRKAA